jgi:mannosylglycerate hydrolase
LRVLFPTSIKIDEVHADGHFDVIARPVALPEGKGWMEPPSPTTHQGRFVDVSDGTAGLALFNRGLPEYEAFEDDSGVGIALTLLRCVGWLSRSDLSTRPGPAGYDLETPGAQCLGKYEFHYALEPHAGSWQAIMHHAEAYSNSCQLMTGRTSEGLLPGDAESPVPWEPLPRSEELDQLPERGSFITLEPAELLLSSVRAGDQSDTLIVRCYNPTSQTIGGRLRSLWPVQSAQLVSFLNEPQDALEVHEGEIRFEVRPKGVTTIHCTLDLSVAPRSIVHPPT